MPNRILRESICVSDSIDKLSWFEEVLYYRLIVNCDDFGRFDGRAAVIKSRLFPLKENITLKTVEAALHGLANAGLVTLYVFEGNRFLCLPTWGKYQTQRAVRSKYPAPENDLQTHESTCEHLQADENTCNHLQADVPVFVFDNRDTIFDNRDTIFESRDTDVCAEPLCESASTPPPVITLTLNDGTEYPVSVEQCQEWAGLYPAVDVIQQLRKMRAWLDVNPTKRKTKRGVKAFVVNWLSREQDRGQLFVSRPKNQPPRKSWAELAAEMDAEEGGLE